LNTEYAFVRRELIVVECVEGLERIGECGVAIVLREHVDGWKVVEPGVSFGLLLLGIGVGEGRSDGGVGVTGGRCADVEVRGAGGDIVIDAERCRQQTDEAGEALAVDFGEVIGIKLLHAKLSGGYLCLGEVDLCVLPGVGAFLDDGDERVGECGLLIDDLVALLVVAEGQKREGGVFGDLFARVFERKLGRAEAGAR
jgi:Holliday junction resolvase-like predicted endonuclease